jgi:hypothetical protein
MKRAREHHGSVVFNRRSRTWHFLWLERGKRRSKVIGTLTDFPTRASAWREAETLKFALEEPNEKSSSVKQLIENYKQEKMPQRLALVRVEEQRGGTKLSPLVSIPLGESVY